MVLTNNYRGHEPIHRYDDDEVGRIVAEAHGGASLEELHCPRDHQPLRVFFAEFATREPGAETHGVLHGEWGDVTVISVECRACLSDRARISLRLEDHE